MASLRDTRCHFVFFRVHAVDLYNLNFICQIVTKPFQDCAANTIAGQFIYQVRMWHLIEGLGKVCVYDVHLAIRVERVRNMLTNGAKFVTVDRQGLKPCWHSSRMSSRASMSIGVSIASKSFEIELSREIGR